MAGDLLLLNMSFEDKQTFVAAGAAAGSDIFHSDKSWSGNCNVLEPRSQNPDVGPSSRASLPAHAYVTFNSANRQTVETYCNSKTQKAKLNNALVKCTRPLGVVSANANLNGWPGNGWEGAASLLLAALSRGNVTIEYYKQDGSPLMDVFGKSEGWRKVPE